MGPAYPLFPLSLSLSKPVLSGWLRQPAEGGFDKLRTDGVFK